MVKNPSPNYEIGVLLWEKQTNSHWINPHGAYLLAGDIEFGEIQNKTAGRGQDFTTMDHRLAALGSYRVLRQLAWGKTTFCIYPVSDSMAPHMTTRTGISFDRPFRTPNPQNILNYGLSASSPRKIQEKGLKNPKFSKSALPWENAHKIDLGGDPNSALNFFLSIRFPR